MRIPRPYVRSARTRRLRRMCHPELKSHTAESFSFADALVVSAAAGPLLRVTQIPHLDTSVGRDGARVWMKGAHLHLQVQSSDINQHDFIRVIAVQQRGQIRGGADLTLTNLLQAPTYIHSFARLGAGGYSKILYDRVIYVPPAKVTYNATTAVYTRLTRHYRIKIPVYGQVIYAGDDTGGSDVLKGEVFLFINCEQAANKARIRYQLRARFTDS